MSKNEQGFSLLEMLLVVVIIGIISIIAIPWLWQAIGAARNGITFASMKTISSHQVNYFVKNNRFARLDEINSETNNTFGVMDGTSLVRGKFTMTMSPITPTDNELRDDYEIIATKPASFNETPCVLSITGSGVVTELFGTSCVDND